MAAYQQQHGVRPLDYYAMHYPGCCGGDQMANLAQRIQTFHGWITSAYPGTKLAFDEYNWGDASQFSSALTTAEGLGIMGREGVDLASFWGLDNVNWPTGYAFRMYRNYDGQGSMFGDTSVSASSANAGQLAVFAAQRSSDGALTLMIINTSGSALSSPLLLSGYQPTTTAQVYQYSAANAGAITHVANLAVASGGFTATYPANSLTMVVLKAASGAVATPTPTVQKTPTPGLGTPIATSTATVTTCPTITAGATPAATPCASAFASTSGNGVSRGGPLFDNSGTSQAILAWIILLTILGGGGGFLIILLRYRQRQRPATQMGGWGDAATREPRDHQWNDVGAIWNDAQPPAQNGGRLWNDSDQSPWERRPQ